MCYLLIEAGYFIGIDKSQLVPSTWVRFLGFLCDAVRQAFLVPEDKKAKFAALREDILSSPFVGLKTLQRFSGKVISFSLPIPGCKLYVRDVFKVISRLSGSTRPSVKVDAALCTEIEYWRFLDNWKDCLPWRTEHHAVVTLYCDASKKAWGGTLLKDGHSLESKDYWLDNSQDINVLEARALLHSLLSFRHHLSSCRVDVHTDSLLWRITVVETPTLTMFSKTFLFAAENSISALMCIMFLQVKTRPIFLQEKFRTWIVCCHRECLGAGRASLWAPHLRPHDSNCQHDGKGQRLPNFTPCATPNSNGINVFAQSLPSDHNLYVFPPFV